MPTEEASFRWLHLNQRIDANAPFVSPAIWRACNARVVDFDGLPVFGGLDLSEVSDLTALVLMAPKEQGGKTIWHVKPTFWLPGDGIRAKAKADRVPYDVWHKDEYLEAAPGRTVDYEFVAYYLRDRFEEMDIRKIAFDRWNFRHLKPWLQKAGFTDDQLEGDDAVFQPFGQGFQSMSPALRELESIILNGNLAHGDHPVLTMCMMNATVKADPAGNRKLVKHNRERRIDGAVAFGARSRRFNAALLGSDIQPRSRKRGTAGIGGTAISFALAIYPGATIPILSGSRRLPACRLQNALSFAGVFSSTT